MERLVFPREERLKKSREISVVFKNGGFVSCHGAKLFFRHNELDISRIACVFSRKFGNAASRNRARRLGREAYRHIRGNIQTGYDLVLLAYPDKEAVFKTRQAQLELLLRKARILK
ncbi:MAG: ribonuclease P protein component [Spirochaetaceae bacterium]|jgi:ribonuclease P protein component|nr:ribonuclease P protein component [Spirochaetaceae bacterium]